MFSSPIFFLLKTWWIWARRGICRDEVRRSPRCTDTDPGSSGYAEVTEQAIGSGARIGVGKAFDVPVIFCSLTHA